MPSRRWIWPAMGVCLTLGCVPGVLSGPFDLDAAEADLGALAGQLASGADPRMCARYAALCDKAAAICAKISGHPDAKKRCADLQGRCAANLFQYCGGSSTADGSAQPPSNMDGTVPQATPDSGAPVPPSPSADGGAPPPCGDGACSGTETCSSCPADCGACSSCASGVCVDDTFRAIGTFQVTLATGPRSGRSSPGRLVDHAQAP